MALVLYGNGVADIRGSIAGNVFSRNRSGAFVRNRTKPINPDTAKQSAARARFTQALDDWAQLTDTQKLGWSIIAENTTRLNKLGQPYIPSARQIFLESANNFRSNGLPIIEDAPLNADVPDMPTGLLFPMVSTGGAGATWDSVDMSDGTPVGGFSYIFYATPPYQKTKSSQPTSKRYIGVNITVATLDLLDLYNVLFPNAPATADFTVSWYVRTLDTATGFASSSARFDTTPTI